MPYSHHSHSGQFCKHAVGTLEEVVDEAIRQEFAVFGFAEHVPRYRLVDLYPEEKDLTIEDLARTFDEYIREAQRLQTAYQDKIALLVGLETDYITSLDIDGLDVLLKRYGDKVDYLVGSIHHANAMPIDLDRQTFNQVLDTFGEGSERMPAFLSSYLDAQYTVLQRFHPEIIGHFDVCRLYHPGLDIQQWPTVWAKVERNVRYAIEYGALFELNASAFKYGWSTAYPGQDVVQLILGCSGRFALSDDSHGPKLVGLNYARLHAYIQATGVKEIWYLERYEERNAGGRRVRPVKAGDEWHMRLQRTLELQKEDGKGS